MRCAKIGAILRAASGRVVSLEVDCTGKVIGCHGPGNSVELFYLVADDVVKNRLLKRLKKQRHKARQ